MNQVLLLIVIALFVILLTAIEYIDILKGEIEKRDRVIENLRKKQLISERTTERATEIIDDLAERVRELSD